MAENYPRCKAKIFFPDCDPAFGTRFQCEYEEGHVSVHATRGSGYDETFAREGDMAPYCCDVDNGEQREVLRFKIWWEPVDDRD